MKNMRLFAVMLAVVFVATLFNAGIRVNSQAATPAATPAAMAPAHYCTPDIAFKDQKAGYYVPVITKGFAAQFWQAVKLGVYQAAADCGLGVSFEGPADETGIADQLDMLTNEIGRHPSAIVFAALDSKAAGPELQQAQAAKIPIIGMDSGVASDIPVTTAATDSVAAGAIAADHMGALIGGSGDIAIVDHSQTATTGVERRDGFVNELKAKYPNINIVDIEYPSGGNLLPSVDAAKAIIAAHPTLKGIYGTNEQTAEGSVQAAVELKMAGKLVVIGFDSGKLQIDAINAGTEAGAITQNPIQIGYKSVEAAAEILNGVTGLPKIIDTGAVWYDKTNINDPTIQAVLYK
jgi:ribose transport system substrate-binding protein